MVKYQQTLVQRQKMGKPVTKYCVISRNSRCIISRCCAIVFMGAAILEQQEQQEKVAYKESFPTTNTIDERRSKIVGNRVFFCHLSPDISIAMCRPTGDKWQLKFL